MPSALRASCDFWKSGGSKHGIGDACCAHVQVQVPYARLSGIQAALAVMHRGLRPDITSHATLPRPWRSLIRRGSCLRSAYTGGLFPDVPIPSAANAPSRCPEDMQGSAGQALC